MNQCHVLLDCPQGCILFAADLLRAIEPCPRGLTMDFMKASSYGSGTESSGEVQLKTDLDGKKVKGRHVILVRAPVPCHTCCGGNCTAALQHSTCAHTTMNLLVEQGAGAWHSHI